MSIGNQEKNINRSRFNITRTLFFVIVFGAGLLSCQMPGNQSSDVGDREARYQADQAMMLLNSLVASEHPDPIAFLNSPEFLSETPTFNDLYRKYFAASHYFNEHLKDLDSALIYADSTLQLFEKRYAGPEFLAYHLNAILLKGDVLRQQHFYGTSTQYYIQGWQMTDPEQMPCLAREFLGRMGAMSYQQENYPGSIDFYTQGWRASFGCSDQTDFIRFRNDYQYFQNMAANYEQLQMPDSALHYQNASLEVLEKDSAKYMDQPALRNFIEVANGVALGNKADVCLKLGRGEEAELLWKESIGINAQPGFANEHAQLMRLRLADYYIDEGRMEEAERELAIARNWLDNFQSDTGERRWHKARWRWLERMGSTEEAYATYRQYVELQETTVNHRIAAGAIDLAAQIRLYEQQSEITRLLTESEIRNAYLISAAIILLMAIVILFLIWRNWQTSKKSVEQLLSLNQTVSAQNRKLEKSNKTLSKIMSVVTHDLRSPLVGVAEVSAVLLEDEELPGKQRRSVELIHDTVRRSMRLAKEILNLNFSQANSNIIRKEPVEINAFFLGCVDILRMEAKQKKQLIEMETDLNEDVVIPIDRDKMARVINNIVGNAIKFSPEGSSIFLKMEKKDSHVRVLVRDEGIGIPDHLKETVFDMFTENKRSGTNDEQSFGLGLSISKQIVDAHGGTIWFESGEGTGTTFFIELPAKQEQLTHVI